MRVPAGARGLQRVCWILSSSFRTIPAGRLTRGSSQSYSPTYSSTTYMSVSWQTDLKQKLQNRLCLINFQLYFSNMFSTISIHIRPITIQLSSVTVNLRGDFLIKHVKINTFILIRLEFICLMRKHEFILQLLK